MSGVFLATLFPLLVDAPDAGPPQYRGDDALGFGDGWLRSLGEGHVHGLMNEGREPLARRETRIDLDQTVIGIGLARSPFTAKLAFLEDQLFRHRYVFSRMRR